MKSLLQINTIIHESGTGRIVEDIGKMVIDQGWNSYIAYGRRSKPSKSKSIRIVNDFNIYMHALETRIADNHGFSSRKATMKLLNSIDRLNPDIIHLHNLHGYYLNIGLLFHYLADAHIPIVWTFHDCWPITGHCTHFSNIECNRWKTKCYNCPQKSRYPTSYFVDRSTKNYTEKRELFSSIKNMRVIAVSQWLKNIIQESFLKTYPIETINNGIDITKFGYVNHLEFQKRYDLYNKKIILGVANGWVEGKGLQDFIKLNSLLDKNYVIILVGLNAQQIKKLPKSMIGIEKTQNVEELCYLYSSANVFLNLSKEETFGLVTVEAMACGTPVIVYDSTASPELVDPTCGRIVKLGSITGIKDAIDDILSIGKTFFSRACRKRVELYYNKDSQFRKYFDIYRELLN